MANGKEYKLAVRIAGVVDKSYEAALISANSQLKAYKASIGNIDKSFSTLNKGYEKMAAVGRAAFNTMAKAATVATVATGALVAKSVQVGSEFEAEMSTVQSISGATGAELAQLSDKAREVAKNSVYSAAEVGQAMEYMGMAGWKTADMLAGVEGVTALAAASGEDLATVSDIVTDSLTAMGKGADEAGHYADIMAQAAMNANTNVSLMGETFKYAAPVAGALGYNMEDLALATGLMANSGIKGSMAGTSLRNMLTRMAKPTKESQDAMDALGLSLTDDTGQMYSLLDIMNQLRANFADTKDLEAAQAALTELAGLTDEQITEIKDGLGELSEAEEAFYAAELGGQRGMSGLLAIANASEEDFTKLSEAIYNASGAAGEMSKIRLDNLQGDITILKDTLSDSMIEMYYQFNDQIRDGVQGATKIIAGVAENIPEVFKNIQEQLPTLKRKYNQYVAPIVKTAKGAFKWMLDNGDKVVSIIGGIAGGMAAFKLEQGAFTAFKNFSKFATDFVNGTLSFNGATPIIAGIAGAVGLLTAAVINYKIAAEEKINNNLAEHFGTLQLTMDEIKEAAAFLTTTDALEAISAATKAFDDLEPFESSMSNAIEQLNKMNWKVSIGMELDPEDQESYKAAVDTYIKNAQDYAEQARFAISLNLNAFSDGSEESSNIIANVDRFYADQYDELSRLGSELSEVVTSAFEDGFLDIDETEAIIKLQQQMANIQEGVAASEFAGTLSLMGQKYGGGNLTVESFENMQAEINELIASNQEIIDAAYVKNVGAIESAYNSGYLTLNEYNEGIGKYNAERAQKIAEIAAQGYDFSMQTIMSQYDLEGLNRQLNELAQKAVEKYLDPSSVDFSMVDNAHKFDAIVEEFNRTAGELIGSTDIDAIAELAAQMQSAGDVLETQAAEMRAAGQEVPESIANALEQWEDLNSLLDLDLPEGSESQVEAVLQYINNVIGSGTYDEILSLEDEWGDSIGAHLPESLESGVRAYSGQYKNAADTAKKQTQSAFDAAFATPIRVVVKLDEEVRRLNSSIPTSVREAISREQQNAQQVDNNATGGIIPHKELSWLAEDGPEAVIPLDGSANALQLWKKTGDLLGAGSLTDRYDLNGATNTSSMNINYNQTLNFSGDAPSKKELTEALEMSQDRFNEMMNEYVRYNQRVTFA